MGKFKIKIRPNTGTEERFCCIEMIVSYREESPHEVYRILEEEAEGLSVAQVKEIVDELCSITTYNENVYDVICSLRDYLSYLNS